MRILVTGNLGYIGGHLTQLLVASGHEVIGCDIHLYKHAQTIAYDLPNTQMIQDFSNMSFRDLSTVDAIIHLAGLSNDALGDIRPSLTNTVNNIRTVSLAERAKKAGVKIFVFASTCAVYGDTKDLIVNEDSIVHPMTHYAKSKLDAEQGLASLADSAFHVYLLRNASAYGASPAFRSDLLINYLASSMHAIGMATIRSDGSPWRPFIHSLDMARALQLFAENDPTSVSGKPVNVGFNNENFHVSEVGVRVQALYPNGVVEYASVPAQNTGGNYEVDFSLLSQIFPDFTPNYPLSLGLPDLVQYLTRIGYSAQDLNLGRFVRMQEIQASLGSLKG